MRCDTYTPLMVLSLCPKKLAGNFRIRFGIVLQVMENVSACHGFCQGLHKNVGLGLSWGELIGRDAHNLHLTDIGNSPRVAHTNGVCVNLPSPKCIAHLVNHGALHHLSLSNSHLKGIKWIEILLMVLMFGLDSLCLCIIPFG